MEPATRKDTARASVMGKVEAKAQLTTEQRDKLKRLMAARWKAVRERMQQGRRDAG